MREGVYYIIMTVVIIAGILGGAWLIGNAVHQNDLKNQEFQIACIQNGGHMELVANGNTVVCQKR